MTDFSRTIDRIREVSADVADDAWDIERNRRELACGSATGSVSVHRGNFVSIELDGLTCEQAVKVLRALLPWYDVRRFRDPAPHEHSYSYVGQLGPYDVSRCYCGAMRGDERDAG